MIRSVLAAVMIVTALGLAMTGPHWPTIVLLMTDALILLLWVLVRPNYRSHCKRK